MAADGKSTYNKLMNYTFRSRILRGIVLGQILSLCLCGTGVSSALLAEKGIDTPAAQLFINYFLLCVVYCSWMGFKHATGEGDIIKVLEARGWKYFVLALIDVEANYLIVKAFQYTTPAGVQIVLCLTIPLVFILSKLFLSVRYLRSHLIGAGLCLIGVGCWTWVDMMTSGPEDRLETQYGSSQLLGNCIAAAAAVLYSISNVCEEYLVKQHSRMEYLGMLGLFSSFIAGIQLSVLESSALISISWSGSTIFGFIAFSVSMFVFYSLVTVVMDQTSAVMFNLSVLTADFYLLIVGIYLFGNKFHMLHIVSFLVVICGSVIYSLKDTQNSELSSKLSPTDSSIEQPSLLVHYSTNPNQVTIGTASDVKME